MVHSRRKRIIRSKKAGLPPGELVHVGEKKTQETSMELIQYSEESFIERDIQVLPDLPQDSCDEVAWINITGLHDTDLLGRVGEKYGIHPLVLEDICNTGQRAKAEDYGEYQYIVVKMVSWDDVSKEIEVEQVSLVLFEKTLLSFQERPGDLFGPVRQRLSLGKGRIRKQGADYLAYSLLDAITDGYFLLIEKIGDQVEAIESDLLADPGKETAARIHELKREMIYLRKAAWPLREAVSALERSDKFAGGGTAVYMRDLYDHVIQVIDGIETIRDLLSGMLDIYLSSVSNRMNEIMKVLTIISTIFIPLTFLAGVYGMNFSFMPELHLKWAYPVVLGVMVTIALWMVDFFRKKGWL
ncbi:MAG: magnesium/cobalt transporter CorA [Thermovirga sp.]